MRELASVELREHFSLDPTTAWMVDYQCRASNSASNLGWCHACSDRCHGTRSCTAPSSTSVQFKLYWYVTSSVCLQNNLGMCGSGHVRPRPRPMHNWATPPGLLLERSNSKNKSITVSNGTVNTTQQMQHCVVPWYSKIWRNASFFEGSSLGQEFPKYNSRFRLWLKY